MSMLAERKQKQRWYLHPRANKEWAEDANKFGQRMLEKMGWTAGKGLGAKEDGMTENIKVKYKNNVQGIGYQIRDDQWTQHENNFTKLLSNLGSGPEASKIDLPKPDKSLEKRSQSSRARVHYHKYTRGKDLASKSEKDLANIFGRKTLEISVKEEVAEESDKEDEKETKDFGVVTIKSGNMAEYFKSKLSKFKFSSTVTKKDEEGESESEMTSTTGFGFDAESSDNKQQFRNFVSNSSKTNNISDESESEISTTTGFGFSPSIKKENFVSFVSSTTQNDEDTEDRKLGLKRKRDEKEDENVPKDKKKKKNKKKTVAFDNMGNDINIAEEVCYDNPCLNDEINEEDNTAEIGFDNPAFNPNDDQEKKKRKSVTFASPLAEYSTISDSPKKKKKNKKKKQEIGIDNPACEEYSFEENSETNLKRKTNDDNLEEHTPVKKLKKKKKNLDKSIDNTEEKAECSNTTSEENKKLKKKKKTIDSEVENSSFEQTPKKDKKKRKTETGINNLGCEESPVNCIDNLACSVNLVEEGIESITNAIDNYQTELENEMNLRKDKKLQKERKLKNKVNENVT